MIDIHTHVLPGLDDGPASIEESLAMLHQAAESGTTDIVATPHANLEFSYDPEVVRAKIRELAEIFDGSLRIHHGCDFHLQYDLVQAALKNPAPYTINGGRYLLVEFSDLIIFRNTEQVLDQLRGAGMVPVVTHPERNPLLQQRIERMQAWVTCGCCLQLTAQSLLGGFGAAPRKCARQLLAAGMVHFVASDAHDSRLRPARLDEAWRIVADDFGEARARLLFVDNPRAVIDNRSLPPQDGEPEPLPRPWYRFW